MNLVIIRALSLLLLIGLSHARERTYRMVYPERPQSAPKMAFVYDGKKSTQIHLPSMNLSEVMTLPKGDVTLFVTDEEIKDPEKIPANVPRVFIPETVIDCYLILIPDTKNSEFPVKINLVDSGDQKLKAGETLWFNSTNHRILAKLGTQEFRIEPTKRAISKPPIPESGYYVARFAFQANATGPAAPITEQSWWHDAKSRHLGFIYDNGEKLPKIYYFRDFRIEGEDQNRKS
jgi:hypothetical protein